MRDEINSRSAAVKRLSWFMYFKKTQGARDGETLWSSSPPPGGHGGMEKAVEVAAWNGEGTRESCTKWHPPLYRGTQSDCSSRTPLKLSLVASLPLHNLERNFKYKQKLERTESPVPPKCTCLLFFRNSSRGLGLPVAEEK